jgi:hypothetical protein
MVWFIVFNDNNISVISWRSVFMVKEIRIPRKTTDLSQVRLILLGKCHIPKEIQQLPVFDLTMRSRIPFEIEKLKCTLA